MPTTDSLELISESPEQTQAWGRCLCQALQTGDVLALCGPLGAGKTCFVQGLAEGMAVGGRVASPTFIVMRCHPGPVPLYHADAYRLGSGEELLDLGLEDWLAEGVVALEWADQVPSALPEDHLQLCLSPEGEQRKLTVRATGPRSQALLEHLRSCAC
jgi:tRNA threonylcarbamoyladenosine biosynthesis protein TsaE